ncbi:hypothetical protein [Mycolicibacterium gilvum]|uniref:hypothetical protein n=1 Tax=Mycolicibacterium gilvum TaxID=1804 RepID=UPI00404539C6
MAVTADVTAEELDAGAGIGPPRLGSDRDRTFTEWWERSGRHWAAVRAEAGGRHRAECPECLKGPDCVRVPQPWTEDVDERRALFDRRHTRPDPPAGLPPVRSVRDLNAPSRRTPTTTTTERY